ncbi:ABC-2 type transport system permease protein OS=Ureibacillus acetophenoni OX=614649 GN=SAMN05877842_102183 PE=4 SV=1 [Ureibacillus acetophenoni]
MIWSIIKKQFKLFLRNPSELLLLLAMPVGLITILSFALGALWDSQSDMEKIELAIVQHGNEEQQIEEFLDEISQTIPLNETLIQNVHSMLPVSTLIDQVLGSSETEEFIHITNLDPSKLEEIRNKNEFNAIIEIPDGFTSDYLTSIFFEGNAPTFQVYLNESEQTTSMIIQNILDYYQYQFSLFSQLGKARLLTEQLTVPSIDLSSEIKTVESKQQISASTYYTFSMTVMFILFLAGSIASQSYIEKDSHIFDRILLAQVHPLIYLLSIVVSTIILAVMQVSILVVAAKLIFNIPITNWGLFLLITLMLSIVVGGISALLSSLNFKSNSANASNLFMNAIVAIMSLLGGSFFNISGLSPVLAEIGLWTPNGAALEGYLRLVQDGTWSSIQPIILNLGILAFIFLLLAFLLFPKRGGIV